MRIPDGELRVWLSEWLKFVEITGFSDGLRGGFRERQPDAGTEPGALCLSFPARVPPMPAR